MSVTKGETLGEAKEPRGTLLIPEYVLESYQKDRRRGPRCFWSRRSEI